MSFTRSKASTSSRTQYPLPVPIRVSLHHPFLALPKLQHIRNALTRIAITIRITSMGHLLVGFFVFQKLFKVSIDGLFICTNQRIRLLFEFFYPRPLLVLLRQVHRNINFRPVNTNIRIIPGQAAFIVRVIKVIALVAELCFVRQH